MRYVGMIFMFAFALHAQESKPKIENFAWLAGCWDGSNDKKETLEQWMKPSGGVMLGTSRIVKNGKNVEYEFMRIHREDNGDIYYTAIPSGQKEASFKLVNNDARQLIFENKEHDFPQRIIYRLEKDGSLLAWIEGKKDGKEMRFDYPMKKVPCE